MKDCEYGNAVTKFWVAYGTKCCGTLGVYDESRAKCCNGQKIVQKDPVCGEGKYDQCTQMCCDRTVHQKEEETACCGQKTYNTKTQICCNKIPVTKFKCKKVWRTYYRLAEAECHSFYGLYYRTNRNRCPGKLKNRKFNQSCLTHIHLNFFRTRRNCKNCYHSLRASTNDFILREFI